MPPQKNTTIFAPGSAFRSHITAPDQVGAIQRILGHENQKTTEIYLHSIGDLERNAMEAFE